MTNQPTHFLAPLPFEHIARLFWASGRHEYPHSWEQVAAWCFGAYSVAERSADRELWHFLGAIAWDHAGMRRDSLDEFDDQALPLIVAAPDLLAFARRTLPMLIAERDCLYDGCTNAQGEYSDDEDRMAVEQMDREIDELRALIARAEGSA